jgi:hypothetical protein
MSSVPRAAASAEAMTMVWPGAGMPTASIATVAKVAA